MAMTPPPPAAAASAPASASAAAAAKAGAHNVFVYGSLMTAEVVRAIIKRVPPAAPALLPP
jgi:folylpolyglutamate synthase/dihydropteroate synthase